MTFVDVLWTSVPALAFISALHISRWWRRRWLMMIWDQLYERCLKCAVKRRVLLYMYFSELIERWWIYATEYVTQEHVIIGWFSFSIPPRRGGW